MTSLLERIKQKCHNLIYLIKIFDMQNHCEFNLIQLGRAHTSSHAEYLSKMNV